VFVDWIFSFQSLGHSFFNALIVASRSFSTCSCRCFSYASARSKCCLAALSLSRCKFIALRRSLGRPLATLRPRYQIVILGRSGLPRPSCICNFFRCESLLSGFTSLRTLIAYRQFDSGFHKD
jgi:hypothetical protein